MYTIAEYKELNVEKKPDHMVSQKSENDRESVLNAVITESVDESIPKLAGDGDASCNEISGDDEQDLSNMGLTCKKLECILLHPI